MASARASFLGISLSLATPFMALSQDKPSGEELYAQACAQCHGQELQGGLAQSLTDAVWQFGSSRSAIFRNIKYGISDFSMPAFEQALSDAQINQVIDFVMASEKASGSVKPLSRIRSTPWITRSLSKRWHPDWICPGGSIF